MDSRTETIIKLMSMPKIGRKTALKFIKEMNNTASDDNELRKLIKNYALNFNLPLYSIEDFDIAFKKADDIIEKSLKQGIKIISFFDSEYPNLLKKIEDFPIILNYKGDISVLNDIPSVAIIGTREPTEFGKKMGIRLGEYFAENKFNIVSGLATGCDTAGHIGALNRNGVTTAVLAHGLDKVYPKENKYLADKIVSNGGLLLSEYFINQSALSNFFIERDRIQAGISLGVIVIETDVKGGTMHTVRYCVNNNRILAAIQYPNQYLHESKTKGNQLLIREKKAIPAYLKEDFDIIMNVMWNNFVLNSNNINSINQIDQEKQRNKGITLNSSQTKISWD